jgi:DNA-binding NarL/FixJ family response regulator
MLSDDYPMVRKGLRSILESSGGYEVCGEADDGTQTLELAARLAPDILILDLSMPPPSGLEVAARLRESLPLTKILVTTMHDSEEMLRAAAASGVAGYLLKSDAEECLVKALTVVRSGEVFISPSFAPEVVSAVKELFE